MASYDEAIAAREKFKEQFWKNSPEKYNVIGIGSIIPALDETDSLEDCEFDDYYVVAYLFDINDAADLPQSIDGVEVKYFPVIEKDEEKKI